MINDIVKEVTNMDLLMNNIFKMVIIDTVWSYHAIIANLTGGKYLVFLLLLDYGKEIHSQYSRAFLKNYDALKI